MEFLCAGTLLHLADRGGSIHVATMTPGDCGSTRLSATAIARLRRKEAGESARLLGARYDCLEERDLRVFYEGRTLRKVMELVRRVSPRLVFTHSPTDYMVDHENTSRLVQTACFGAMATTFKTGSRRAARATGFVPHLYYAAPFGGRDILGRAVKLSLWVNTTQVIGRQTAMLACHKSQREWLESQQGIDNYLGFSPPPRRSARQTGRRGFRRRLPPASGSRLPAGQFADCPYGRSGPAKTQRLSPTGRQRVGR